MFTWPETVLPLPSYSFDVDAEFSNIRSKMDSGRVRQRPRFTNELELASVRFELTRVQYAVFKGVWKKKLNNGNDWFTMRLPVANNETLTLSEIRFVSDFKATHRPFQNWDISATIEFKDSAEISESLLDLFLLYGEDLSQFAADIEGVDEIFPKDWRQ